MPWKSPMIKAVLLDLDDTLLSNPADNFEQSLEGWNTFFSQRTGLPNAGQGMAAALRAVVHNLDPTRSNLDVYVSVLSEQWRMPEAAILEHFQAFYGEVYAHLEKLVSPREAAPGLVEWLRAMGYQVVIATNPFFTAEAVAQRLAWAGLPTDFKAYALVTHIGNMHFTKPNPHYYEEILGRLGVANDEAIMVGDDWLRDIVAAEQAGLHTYWIREDDAQPGPGQAQPDGQGTLNDFALRVCNLSWLDTLKPRPLRPSMIIPRLLGNVGALFGLLDQYTPDYWQQHPDPDEWSPLEVVCHLRDSERTVQRPRLEAIAREDNPFLSVPKEPPGPGQIACDVVHYGDPAEEFAAERQKTIAFLQSLPPEAWYRPARHSIFGPTTLLEMANFTATHDRLHLQQICLTMGSCS